MENEFSFFVKIGIRLGIIATLMGLLLMLFNISKVIPETAVSRVDNAYVATASYEWKALIRYNEPIPAASLYAMILKNEGKLNSISGTVFTVNVNDFNDLTQLLSKQVVCTVTSTGDDTFDVVLSEP